MIHIDEPIVAIRRMHCYCWAVMFISRNGSVLGQEEREYLGTKNF